MNKCNLSQVRTRAKAVPVAVGGRGRELDELELTRSPPRSLYRLWCRPTHSLTGLASDVFLSETRA